MKSNSFGGFNFVVKKTPDNLKVGSLLPVETEKKFQTFTSLLKIKSPANKEITTPKNLAVLITTRYPEKPIDKNLLN